MSYKVTYAEIIEALSEKTGFSKLKSEAFSKALINAVKEELEETGKASITNFGSFKVKDVAERQGQNPQTGEPITIPAHKRVSFTPYKALKEEVNTEYAHLETELIGEDSTNEAEVISFDDDDEEKPFKRVEPNEPEPVKFTSPMHSRDRARGKNTGLMIMAVLALVIVALASVWFLVSSGEEELASSRAVVEQPQTPEAAAQVIQEEPDEPVRDEEQAQEQKPEVPAEPQVSTTSATSSTEERANTTAYTVKENEWYWVVSRNVYGKAHFWPLIFQENFTVNDHPDSLETNVRLRIPTLEGTSDDLTKTDYRKLAAASALVSDAYQNFGRTDKAREYARFARRWEKAGM